ncbi:TonB-dependent receptor [Campylobacter concisus]|uniref:TonB-dependent siderophore receptor n=1 Tax=Campylobacter concisus TaxID=199 RepID=UPI0018A99878|nr:TonB-dependent receptor [Campylobacter concisus]QPI00079.1 TonB-dependent receptor [Campylobacter concisus]QPI01868.1 TonB-dependent receptor [Campylobacter concisus]
MNKFRISAVLCFAISALNATDVSLDGINIEDSADDGYRATTSEVGKTNTPILEIPQTVNVVTQQQLKDKKPETLAESLQNVSGVSYGNTTGGIFDSIIKRGFGGGRDGSIMRNGVSASVMHSFNKTVESVEVLKGPSSLLYGAQEPGGIINMVTKKPKYDFSNEIWAGIGNRNYWNTGFDTTGPIAESGFAYRFIFDTMQKDYWREFGEYKNVLFAPSLSYKGDDYRINFAYAHTRSTDPIDRGMYLIPSTGKLLPIDKKRRLDEPFNKLKTKLDTLDVNFEKNLGENWLLKGAYAFSRSKHEYGHIRLMNVNLNNGTATRRNEYYDGFIHRTHAGSLNLNGYVKTGEIEHNLLFGIDAKEYYRYRPGGLKDTGNHLSINIYHPIYGRVGLPTARESSIQYQKLKTIGFYAQDSINLTENLIYSLGTRYEYYDQVARGTTSGPNSTDQQDGKFTWQTGLLYLLTPQWSVYTNYAQSFNPQMAMKGDIGDIKPEEGKSIEFGSKFQNDSITASAAVFNINKKNIMRTVSGVSTPVGEARSRGFEFDFNGRVTQGLSVGASYAFTKTEVRKDSGAFAVLVGKPLEATPKHQASLFANYDFSHLGAKGLRIGGGARYFGSWYTYYMRTNLSAVPAGTAFKMDSALVYDAFISYDTKIAGYETNFSFNVKNLTDKLYYTSSSTGTDANIIPIQPGYARQFMLTASVKF